MCTHTHLHISTSTHTFAQSLRPNPQLLTSYGFISYHNFSIRQQRICIRQSFRGNLKFYFVRINVSKNKFTDYTLSVCVSGCIRTDQYIPMSNAYTFPRSPLYSYNSFPVTYNSTSSVFLRNFTPNMFK